VTAASSSQVREYTVFDEPHAFDLRRSPNPHLGIGAELRNLFRELLTRLKTVEFGEPDLLYSSFVHGVKRLPAFIR
jgi:cytochrome P450